MFDIFKKKKIPLFINYMRRSDPGVIQIKRNIENEDFNFPFKGFSNIKRKPPEKTKNNIPFNMVFNLYKLHSLFLNGSSIHLYEAKEMK